MRKLETSQHQFLPHNFSPQKVVFQLKEKVTLSELVCQSIKKKTFQPARSYIVFLQTICIIFSKKGDKTFVEKIKKKKNKNKQSTLDSSFYNGILHHKSASIRIFQQEQKNSHTEIGFSLTISWEMKQIFLIKPHGSSEICVTPWHTV